MEHLGVSKPVVGITVPTGYSFNLDGTAIYLTMASLFIADAMGDPLTRRRADLAAALHGHRLEGRGGRHRRRPRHPGRRPPVAPPRTGRRRRPDRRHRPLHERGPRPDQLRGQRGRHGPGRHLDQGDRQGAGRPRSSPGSSRSTSGPWSTTTTAARPPPPRSPSSARRRPSPPRSDRPFPATATPPTQGHPYPPVRVSLLCAEGPYNHSMPGHVLRMKKLPRGAADRL